MSAPGARDTALRVLVSCRTARAWADAALSAQLRRDGLTGPEAALCSRIVYGVMQNRLLLDFYLGAYCSQKLDRLQPPLAEILRIGAYQILYLDKVPDSAAVNQAVEQAKANGRSRASGLVNAVLRQLSRNKGCLPAIPDREEAQALSIRYSHPKWLVKRLLSVLGPETEAFLAANNAPAPLTIQVNPLRTDAERLTAELAESGVTVRTHPWVPGCLELSHTGDLTALPAFQAGKFLVQDPAARLVSLAAGVRPGDRVLDVCAAPGGKSFSSAFAMEDRGEIVSCDLHENKLKRVREGAERLGLTCIRTAAADGRVFRPEWEDAFDAVLVDAPLLWPGHHPEEAGRPLQEAGRALRPAGDPAGHSGQRRPVCAARRNPGVLHLHRPAGGERGRLRQLSCGAPGVLPRALCPAGPCGGDGGGCDAVAPPPQHRRLLHLPHDAEKPRFDP